MKTITIKSYGLGRYDDVSPFIISEGKIDLKIVFPSSNGEFFFVAENNGTRYKKPINGQDVVTLEGLTAGELIAEVKHYLRGQLIESYRIEPLILKAVDGDLTGISEITAFLHEQSETLASLKKTNETLSEAYNKAIEVINDLSARVYALEKNYDPTIID